MVMPSRSAMGRSPSTMAKERRPNSPARSSPASPLPPIVDRLGGRTRAAPGRGNRRRGASRRRRRCPGRHTSGIRSRSSRASIENSCWSESTCRIARHRSSKSPVEVRDAGEPDLAGGDQLDHRAPRVLDRHARLVGPVQLDRGRSRRCRVAPARRHTRPGPGRGGTRSLRRTGRPSSPRRARRGAPRSLSRRSPPRPAPVDLRRVDPGHPRIEGGVVGPHDVVVVGVGAHASPPASQAPSPITEISGPAAPSRRVRMWRYNHVPVKSVRGQYAVCSTAS